jgi:hypothetical protein
MLERGNRSDHPRGAAPTLGARGPARSSSPREAATAMGCGVALSNGSPSHPHPRRGSGAPTSRRFGVTRRRRRRLRRSSNPVRAPGGRSFSCHRRSAVHCDDASGLPSGRGLDSTNRKVGPSTCQRCLWVVQLAMIAMRRNGARVNAFKPPSIGACRSSQTIVDLGSLGSRGSVERSCQPPLSRSSRPGTRRRRALWCSWTSCSQPLGEARMLPSCRELRRALGCPEMA